MAAEDKILTTSRHVGGREGEERSNAEGDGGTHLDRSGVVDGVDNLHVN